MLHPGRRRGAPRLGAPPDAPSPRPARRRRRLARVGGARLRPRRLRGLRARARAAAGGLAAADRARVHRAAERAAGPRDPAARSGAARRSRPPCGPRGGGSCSPPRDALATGAYRVDWHTVSTEDGHALEGAFSFGVRADAGAAPALETGPLARGGLVRILARIALYSTILMLAAALLLPLLIGRPRGWPVPDLDPGDGGGRVDLEEVRARERRLRGDVAWAAVAAAVVATVADAADAARGIDPARMGDYLAGNVAGAGRALVVVALLAAALLRDRRPRAAAGAVVLALRRASPPRARGLGRPARAEHPQRLAAPGLGRAVARRHRAAGAALVAGRALHAPRARAPRSRARCSRRSGASRPARSSSR